MANLKETAKEFVPKLTLNIADLDRVDLSFPIEDRTGTDADGKDFSYQVMIANSLEYRVPSSVLEEIKKILKLKADVGFVNVTKAGSGLSTRYSVEALE